MATTKNLKKTILLLDDEESDRSVASKLLQSQGYAVLEADCYKTALSTFEARAKTIDLLIADISLPDGNGCELAAVLLLQKADLKVLFVSGHVGSEVCRFYGLEVTDLHFLSKPFQDKDLLKRVTQVMESTEPAPRLLPKTRTA